MSDKKPDNVTGWFENAADLLCIVDAQMCFQRVNPAFVAVTHQKKADLLDRSICDFLHPEDVEAMKQAVLNGERVESRFHMGGAGYIWLDWTCGGHQAGADLYQLSARDITEYKSQIAGASNDIRLLELAEQTANVGHWHLDIATGQLQWSQEVFKIYGRKPNKAVISLDDFIDAFSGSHQKELWSLLQKAMNDGSEIHTELVLTNDKVGRRNVVIKAVSERDAQGTVCALFGIIQDVTDERLRQASLRSKEELLSMAFRATSDGIWDWDLQSDQMWFSPQWKAQLGYEEDELTNSFESWSNVIFDEDRLKALDMMDEHFRAERDRFEMILRFRHKRGHTIFVLVRAYAMRDENGRAIRVIGAHTDVTELKKLEQAKSEFTSIVSHELRTPLTALHGAIGLLNGHFVGELPEQAASLVRIAMNNSERLKLLINDILDMDRLQSGRMDFDIKLIVVKDFINRSVESLRAYGTSFDVELDYDGSGNNLVLNGDENRLMQVMANLISNAIKFSNKGDVVKLRAHARNGKIAIAVMDTGCGIPREMRDKVFDKFIQVDSSDQRHSGGTGLGLTISKAMIEKMNGTISVVSKVGEGSTFTITLPAP